MIGISLVAYPFVVFLGLKYFSLQAVGSILLLLFLLRIVMAKKSDPVSLVIGCSGFLLITLSLLFDELKLVYLYPIIISLVLFIVFFVSYIRPPTIIEKIARLTDKSFTDEAIPYTRKVTVVWMLFFLVNASIASYTVLQDNVELWTIYNGLISYLIMGTIFVIEFIVRKRVKSKYEFK